MTTTERRHLQEALGLASAPVALAFVAQPPAGIPRVPVPLVSGCSYWPAAAAGQTFYTEASDHFGCPVGSHTHGVQLTPDKARELGSMVETMVGLEYLQATEVAGIPQRREPFQVLVYAPLADAEFEPDVVLVRGTVKQIMLLAEAAQAAGALDGRAVGRPACAMIPAAMSSGQAVSSLGCIGNRTYTGLGDDEAYLAVPGPRLAAVTEKLTKIVAANRALAEFHGQRKQQWLSAV